LERVCAAIALAALAVASACGPRLLAPSPNAPETDRLRRDLAGNAAQLAIEQIRRIDAVAIPIRVAGVPVCAPQLSLILGASLGGGVVPQHDLAFDDALGLGRDVSILTVLADTPADRAELRAGDVVLAVNDHAVDQIPAVYEELRQRRAATDIRVRRNGVAVTARLEALVGCGFEVEYLPDSSLATGRAERGHAFVTAGFVSFVRSDDELAVVIAHELGHRILGDRSNGGFAEHEIAADRIGLYLAARGGYDVTVAPALWERIAIEMPWMIAFERESNGEEEPAHGRIGKRLPAMRRVVAEIREKQARGDDLMP
jgi:hypothetical protein